jgi:hypothetical protein
MLTVDFEQFPVEQGERVLDMGCGAVGTPSPSTAGARPASPSTSTELKDVAGMFAALAPEVPEGATLMRCVAAPTPCPSPTAPSTRSSPRRSSSTCPRTRRRWPSSPASSSPVA